MSQFSEETHEVYKKKPLKDTIISYDNWVDYETDLKTANYNATEIGAKCLASFYTDAEIRSNLEILDVGAGTGWLGEHLIPLGFKTFDALDGSKGILDILRAKGIYRNVFEALVGDGRIVEGIEKGSYDCLITIGSMMDGHIPLSAIQEFLRMVKSGGHIFIVIREEYAETDLQFGGKFREYVDGVEKDGLWKLVKREIYPDYVFGKNGVAYIFQVV